MTYYVLQMLYWILGLATNSLLYHLSGKIKEDSKSYLVLIQCSSVMNVITNFFGMILLSWDVDDFLDFYSERFVIVNGCIGVFSDWIDQIISFIQIYYDWLIALNFFVMMTELLHRSSIIWERKLRPEIYFVLAYFLFYGGFAYSLYGGLTERISISSNYTLQFGPDHNFIFKMNPSISIYCIMYIVKSFPLLTAIISLFLVVASATRLKTFMKNKGYTEYLQQKRLLLAQALNMFPSAIFVLAIRLVPASFKVAHPLLASLTNYLLGLPFIIFPIWFICIVPYFTTALYRFLDIKESTSIVSAHMSRLNTNSMNGNP